MLSNTSKYAVRAVIYLALHAGEEKKIGIKKISEDLKIPSPFLGKILQSLAKHKLLSSTKGPSGGFGLGRPAEEITLYHIVDIIDGNDLFENCLISLNKCSQEEPYCPMHDRYVEIRKELKTLFQQQTIHELAADAKENKKINI
jgi:Rrf2 family protein